VSSGSAVFMQMDQSRPAGCSGITKFTTSSSALNSVSALRAIFCWLNALPFQQQADCACGYIVPGFLAHFAASRVEPADETPVAETCTPKGCLLRLNLRQLPHEFFETFTGHPGRMPVDPGQFISLGRVVLGNVEDDCETDIVNAARNSYRLQRFERPNA
jgi:hypothetical protein